MKQVLIDKITVPSGVKDEFIRQMNVNREFIKKLPGFERDEVYESEDEKGNVIFITIAVWKNTDALKVAKKLVEAEYQRIGFDPKEFCKQRDIIMERGIYQTHHN